MADEPILVINSGSSSLKFGLYIERDGEEHSILDGLADGIGRSAGRLEVKDAQGRSLRAETANFKSGEDALHRAAACLAGPSQAKPVAIGHRIVHGGPHLVTHQLITPAVLAELKNCVHFAPLHIPASLQLIEAAGHAYGGVPQFVCFDTAF